MPNSRIVRLRCYRCGWVWRPRVSRVRLCARCKSALWEVPRIRKVRRGHGAGVEEILGPHRVEILRLARKHGVRRVRVFGSVARNEATPESDVDLLLEFGRGASTLGRFRLAADLGGLIGRRVDAGVPDGLHWLVRPQVMSEAVDL